MRKFLKKPLVYLLATMMFFPTWIVTGLANVQHTKAYDMIKEGFDGGVVAPSGWTFNNIGGTYESASNYGVSAPSLKLDATGDEIDTPAFSNATQLSFWLKGQGTGGLSKLTVESYDGATWSLIDEISSLPTTGETLTYSLNSQAKQVRFVYTKDAGNLSLDDVFIGDDLPNHDIKNVTKNAYYENLTQAIASASSYDEIEVAAGTYEEAILLDKPLRISSTGVVNLSGILLKSSDVELSNVFTKLVIVYNGSSIDTAVKSTSIDGLVYVQAGLYDESVVINKPINLVGENEQVDDSFFSEFGFDIFSTRGTFPIISQVGGDAITVDSANGLINGFEIKDSSVAITFNRNANFKINGNIFTNNTLDIDNASGLEINAITNFWGDLGPQEHKLMMGDPGNILYSPWYLEREMVTYGFSTTSVDETDQVTAYVPTNIATYNNLSSGRVMVEILADTRITAASTWNGELVNGISDLPDGINLDGNGLVSTDLEAIEIGAGEEHLYFSQPVRITFFGKAGKRVGFLSGNTFTEITTTCVAAGVLPDGSNECKMNDNSNNLVVYTNHFTKYATFNQSQIIAPSFTATANTINGAKTIHFAWKGTGADSYILKVGEIETIIAANANDLGTDYVKDVTILNYGTYSVSIISVKSSVRSINNSSISVVLSAPVAPVVTSTPDEVVGITPQKAAAAAVTEPQPNAVTTTPDDSKGQIKGDEETKESEESKINWTPWIVLFVLILLAGAATGGYFYWFNGEEEAKAAIPEVAKEVKTPKATPVVTKASNQKKPQKKSKRW